MKEIIKKEDSQVFLAHTERGYLNIDVVEFDKLKGNPYQDTKQGIIRISKAGNYNDGGYVNIQFRKTVGKYTHLNTASFNINQLKEILDHLNN